MMNFANVVISIVGLQGCRENSPPTGAPVIPTEVMRGLKYNVRLPGFVNVKVKKGKGVRGCHKVVGLSK